MAVESIFLGRSVQQLWMSCIPFSSPHSALCEVEETRTPLRRKGSCSWKGSACGAQGSPILSPTLNRIQAMSHFAILRPSPSEPGCIQNKEPKSGARDVIISCHCGFPSPFTNVDTANLIVRDRESGAAVQKLRNFGGTPAACLSEGVFSPK